MTLVRYNPLNEVVNFNTFFRRFCNDSVINRNENFFQPVVDVLREGDKIVVNAELPGVDKDNISIDVTENTLTVKGEKQYETEEKKENFFRKESVSGSFERSFGLPEGVTAEEIKAVHKDGVLRIEIPKKKKEQPKRIKIK